MDRFSALKAFTRVVEAGSFTRAADSLDMPNATLSKTIKQLEAHLGVSLLQRTTRRITVTPEGREYYEKARCLLEDLEEIDASFNTAHNKPKGHLRIAIGGSTACDVLIPLLADFMTSNESNAHIAAGEAGLGIVQTFTYSLKPALASGKLVEILAAWRPAPYPFHVVYARHRHVPPRLRVFIEWLAAVFPAAVQG